MLQAFELKVLKHNAAKATQRRNVNATLLRQRHGVDDFAGCRLKLSHRQHFRQKARLNVLALDSLARKTSHPDITDNERRCHTPELQIAICILLIAQQLRNLLGMRQAR